MWYSYISIDIDRYFTKYLDIDIDTPAIVARQNGAKTQCSIYQCTVICTVRVFVCTVSNHIHWNRYRARAR